MVHLGSFLDSSSALLAVAACTALGEIGRNGALLIPDDGAGFTKLSAMENLLARIPSGKESSKVTRDCPKGRGYSDILSRDHQYAFMLIMPQIFTYQMNLNYLACIHVVQMKERSIQTLGYLPVGDGDFPYQKKLLQGLMDSVEV